MQVKKRFKKAKRSIRLNIKKNNQKTIKIKKKTKQNISKSLKITNNCKMREVLKRKSNKINNQLKILTIHNIMKKI